MSDANKAIVQQMFEELWNAGNLDLGERKPGVGDTIVISSP